MESTLYASLATPEDLQTFVALLLGYRPVEAPEDLETLIAQLDGPHALDAASKLRRIRDPRALPALVRALDGSDPTTRAMAAAAIRALGTKGRKAIPKLLETMVKLVNAGAPQPR